MRVGGAASAADAGRRAVTPQRRHHHRHHHRHRRHRGRSDAAAPTSSETSAVTREACYEFVRSGCKPRESFRCARTRAAAANARTRAAAGGRTRDGRDRGVFASGVWARATGRNDRDGTTARRGGRERDDDDDDDDDDARWTTRWTTDRPTERPTDLNDFASRTTHAESARSTKSLGTTRRRNEGWITASSNTC